MRDSDKAYNALLDQLLTGKLRCGQAINDEQLQAELGVGKTPLREALFRLIQDGYITAVPHRGMFVTSIDLAQLESLFSLRILLADYLCQKLIQNARSHEIDLGIAEMKELIRLNEKMTLDDVSRADYRFHQILGELSGDTILAGILNKLEFLSAMALIPHSGDYYSNEEMVKAEYFSVLQYLKDGDAEALSAALKRHVPKYVLQHS